MCSAMLSRRESLADDQCARTVSALDTDTVVEKMLVVTDVQRVWVGAMFDFGAVDKEVAAVLRSRDPLINGPKVKPSFSLRRHLALAVAVPVGCLRHPQHPRLRSHFRVPRLRQRRHLGYRLPTTTTTPAAGMLMRMPLCATLKRSWQISVAFECPLLLSPDHATHCANVSRVVTVVFEATDERSRLADTFAHAAPLDPWKSLSLAYVHVHALI